MKDLPSQRPAETSAVAAAIVVLIASVAGLDNPATLTALVVVVGFIPTAVTWTVVTLRRPKA